MAIKDYSEVKKLIEDNDVVFADLRFTDTKGKEQHISLPISCIDEKFFEQGKMFDGSSIAGWRGIDKSDMILMPDITTVMLDPFYADPTIIVRCDILEPQTLTGYDRDPRSVAKRAEDYLKSTGIGDKAFFGPEPEFFLFDDVRFKSDISGSFVAIDDIEAAWNSATEYEGGNKGYRPAVKGGYFPVPPVDSSQDIRSAMCKVMQEMGLVIEAHHHEVATAGQNEIATEFNSLTKKADEVQIYKYVVQNVANQYGKTATFMPKPIYGDNGSGMHCNISLFKDGKNAFYDENAEYQLSDTAKYAIGGLLKHVKSITAILNPTVNSYKRLVPGYEAPVYLAWSLANRSALLRVPAKRGVATRVELRSPDPACNPYLAFATILEACLDGIRNKIEPPAPVESNIYKLTSKERKRQKIDSLPGTLIEAVDLMNKSLVANAALGQHIMNEFVVAKEKEWDDYRTCVTQWEINKYLARY